MRNATFEPTAISAPGMISTDNSDGFTTFRLALSLPISAGVGGSFTSTGGKLIMSKPGCAAFGAGLLASGLGATGLVVLGATPGADVGVGSGAAGTSAGNDGEIALGALGTNGGSDDDEGAGVVGISGGCESMRGAGAEGAGCAG